MILATQTDSSLLRNAGEGWGGGERDLILALAPIRPLGTFPRGRGKDSSPGESMCAGVNH